MNAFIHRNKRSLCLERRTFFPQQSLLKSNQTFRMHAIQNDAGLGIQFNAHTAFKWLTGFNVITRRERTIIVIFHGISTSHCNRPHFSICYWYYLLCNILYPSIRVHNSSIWLNTVFNEFSIRLFAEIIANRLRIFKGFYSECALLSGYTMVECSHTLRSTISLKSICSNFSATISD